MQKDETSSCQGSVLNLGSVEKILNEVTPQTKADYIPNSQHAAVMNAPSFYDGVTYPSLGVTMKRDSMTAVQSSRDGSKGYVQPVGFSGANTAVGRETYCKELFYGEGENVGLADQVLQGQEDQRPQGKVVFTSGGQGFESNILEQNSSYFSVPINDLQLAIVSSNALRNGQVSSEKSAFIKDRKTDDSTKQSHDAKPIRILQRPASQASSHSEKCVDEEEVKMFDALTLLPQKRSHHRKKTLSLNPEEREALESLVEEVIIGGFEEDIASSDETGSEDDDLNIPKAVDERKRNAKDPRDRGDVGIRYADQLVLEKTTKPLQQRDMSDGKRNHLQKDFVSKTVNKYGRKDQRKKDSDHFSSKVKTDHRTVDCNLQQNKTVMLNSEKEKNEDRVQGLNIYPAQLKVAIKHMDSLPPRFLRRLQSGQNRLDLILPRHSEMALDDRGEIGTVENDKGKSKVTQETKKSIRNLLCDLDQYVDEGLSMPVMKESLTDRPFSLNPCDQSMDNGAFRSEGFSGVLKQSSPPDRMKSLNYLNQQPFNSRLFPIPMDAPGVLQVPRVGSHANVDSVYLDEKSGFLSKNVVYQCEEVEKLLKSGSDIFPAGNKMLYCNVEKDFMQQNTENFSGSGDFDLYGKSVNAPVNMKKSQFSVDAPEFVSAFFNKTNGTVDAGAGFQAGLFNPLPPGNASVLSQSGVPMPVYVTSEAEHSSQGALNHEVLPGTTSSEVMSRMKFLGMAGLPDHLTSYQTVPFVPASTLTSSTYLDPVVPPSQMPSELFASPVPCPPPAPSHPSHAVVGMMHYQPYQFPPYVPGFGHPEFALNRSNFLVSAPPPPPNWVNEMQPPNGLPMAAIGWCPPGQAPFVGCPLGQQLPEKAPVLLCNPGSFLPDSNYAAWNWQSSCGDFDGLYQKVSELLNNGELVFVVIISGAAGDLSTITSQLHGICDESLFLSTNEPMLSTAKNVVVNSESSGGVAVPFSSPENQDAMNLSLYSSAEMEFKLKQVFQGKRRLVILELAFGTQPWDIQNYFSMAQGLGYQVEMMDLSETGQYPGSEASGSFLFEEDYNTSLIYPPPPVPDSDFLTGNYSAPFSAPQSLMNDVS